MRVVVRVLVTVALISAAGVVAAQGDDSWFMDGCRFEDRGEEEIIDCTGNSAKGGFWSENGLEIGLAGGGLVLTGVAGFFTTRQVRRRRHAMSSLLAAINTTYANAKDHPEVGVHRLAALRHDIQARYHRGRLEDAQFIELDKRILECVTNLRVMGLERRFPLLPGALFGEIRDVVRDGVLSETDVGRIERRAAGLNVPAAQRRELASVLTGWSNPASAARPAVRRAVLVKA